MVLNDEVYMQIQWIDMVFNKMESGDEKWDVLGWRDGEVVCGFVCSVDEVVEVGEIVEIKNDEVKDNGLV